MKEAQFWQQFALHSRWSLEAVMIPPLLILLSVFSVGLAIAVALQKPFLRAKWHFSFWFVLTQLLFFFPATVAVGVLLPAASPGPYSQANAVGQRWLDALFFVSLVTGCFWIYWMKGIRWFAASLVGLQEVLIFAAGFIAGMSVSGQWL